MTNLRSYLPVRGSSLQSFLRREDGAVTVDWVVLTAAIVLLGVAAGFTVTAGVPHLANSISSTMVDMEVGDG